MRVSSVLKQKFYCQALSNYSKTVKGKARGTKGTDSLSRRIYCSNPNYDCTMSHEGCLHHLQRLFFNLCTKYVIFERGWYALSRVGFDSSSSSQT